MDTKNIKEDVVLIVEDTAENHEIISTFLTDINVKFESAFNGRQAIEFCENHSNDYYSLILMDIHMPDMNGFDATIKLRKMNIHVPIIAITAASKSDERFKNSNHPFDLILFKPFNASTFFSVISSYIKKAAIHAKAPETIDVRISQLPELDPSICNVREAISNLGGSNRLFTKHYNNFKKHNVDLQHRMEHMIKCGRYKECSSLCHAMKGLTGMLGMTSLYTHMVQLEDALSTVIADACPDEVMADVSEILCFIREDLLLLCQVQF